MAPGDAVADFITPAFWTPEAVFEGPDLGWACPEGWLLIDICGPPPINDVSACRPGWEVPPPSHRCLSVECSQRSAEGACDRTPYTNCREQALPGEPACLPEANCRANIGGDLWVDSNAPPGGDGSRERPLNDLGEALARPGDLALRAGRYRWPAHPVGVRNIMATCPEQVTIVGTLYIVDGDDVRLERLTIDAEDAEAAVVARGGDGSLVNVEVRGGTQAALRLEGGWTSVIDVRIAPGPGMGVQVDGGEHLFRNVRVEARAAPAAQVSAGHLTWQNVQAVDTDGLRIDGGSLYLTHVHVLRPLGLGLHARGGALVGISQLSLFDTRPQGNTTGVLVEEGATLSASFSRLVRAGARGIVARGEGTRLDLRQQVHVVHGPTEGGTDEGGIRIEQGAQAEINLTEIFGAAHTGLAVTGPGSLAAVDRLLIQQTLPDASDTAAIRVEDGARLTGRAVSYHGTLEVGAAEVELGFVHGIGHFETIETWPGSHLVLTDAWIQGGEVEALHLRGGRVEATRAVFWPASGEHPPPIYAEAGELSLTDTHVEGARYGLATGAATRLLRTTIGRSSGVGLLIVPGGEVSLDDVLLFENGLRTNEPGFQIEVQAEGRLDGRRVEVTRGAGINLLPGAHAALDELWLHDLRDFGLLTEGEATLTLRHARIEGVRQDRERAPVGISLAAGTRALFEQVHLTDNEHTGLVCSGARLDATDLSVHDTPGTDIGTSGRGLVLTDGCHATLTRTSLARNRSAGLSALGPTTEVDATDLWIYDLQPDDTERAFGLFVLSSRVTLRGALIEGGPHVGLIGLEGAHIIAERLWIRDTLPSYLQADGLVLQGGSTFEGQDILLTDHPGTAALVERGVLTLDRALIARSGVGLMWTGESTTRLEGVVFQENETDRCEAPCAE